MTDTTSRGAEEAQPTEDLQGLIQKLEDRSYKTYKCRLFAHERLARKDTSSNRLLVVFSTSTTVSAIGMLAYRDMYGPGGDALMAALAVVSLVASLVVANANYATRAKAMEASYKEIQRISTRAENLRLGLTNGGNRRQQFVEIQDDYLHAINSSENHEDRDNQRFTSGKKPSWAYTNLLYALPVILLIPFAAWFFSSP